MKQILIVLLLVLLGFKSSFAQIDNGLQKERLETGNGNDLSNDKTTGAIEVNTTASDYKFITIDKDTTFIDTTLSIKKEYKFNYLKRDYFELLPFSNAGQVFNRLGYDFTENNNLLSLFGARAKHVDYAEVRDIKYYEVATPLTELFFRTTMEQGQLAEGFFTVNTTPRFNVAVAYKGLRSLGKYRHIKANGGKFQSSLNYRTKNDRYFVRAHIAMQSIENEENGGITDDLVSEFENGNGEFKDRSRFDVNFQDADNKLSAKRFYINHYYDLFKEKDSVSSYAISVGHIANLEDKKYQFNQTNENAFFGDAFVSSNIRDEVRLEKLYNELYVSLFKDKLGKVTVSGGYTDYNYGYNSVVSLSSGEVIPNRLKGGFASYGVAYENKIGDIDLKSSFKGNLSKSNEGSYFDVIARYKTNNDILVEGRVALQSVLPNFNLRLYQSDYKNYNWYNSDMSIVKRQVLAGKVKFKNYVSLKASYTTIKNHAYFGIDSVTNSIKPFQTNSDIQYLKLTANKEFKLGHFALDNTVQYQDVTQSAEVFNVPELIFRNTLYYTNTFFKKNLFLQTGVIFNYFTEYKMDAYDPLLGEFYTQTANEYGNFPRLDFFVNFKVRNARIYFKAEHFNSSFTGYDFYSAPNYPYKDFTIRFGLVWNFFL